MPNYLAQFLKDPQAPGGMSVAGRMDPSVAWDYNRPMIAEALKGAWTAAQDPQTWRDAAQQYGQALLAGSVAPGMKGIRAFHGSPYDFDKFSLSKIGTGEGAQAYGHGLYFAGAEDVAKGYRDNLSRRNIAVTLDGKPVESWPTTIDSLQAQDWRLAKLLDQYGRIGGDPREFVQQQRDWVRGDAPMEAALGRFVDRVKADHTPGRMYEVNIAATPEQLLDWDKPLSAQPEGVRAALGKIPWADAYVNSSLPGGQVAPRTMEGVEALRAAGIPGIQYLDAGSRGAGEGSRNYVIFDDTLIKIIRKYGLAPLLMGGGVAASDQ